MTQATPVHGCLGWKPTDDGQAILIGLKAEGGRFTLAMDDAASK
jgi:hypothetical protein